MNCPICHAELPDYVLERGYDDFCMNCGSAPRDVKRWFRDHLEARYCPRVRDGEITEAEFEEGECVDCVGADCILSTTILDNFGMVQDEEGNWCYPGDLEDHGEDDF